MIAVGLFRPPATQTGECRRSDQVAPIPFEPAPTPAAGLPQMALAVLPGARGLRPLDAFPGARAVKHIAAGPKRFPGPASSPTRGMAGSDSVQPASVVLSLRRRRPAPDRFPWRKAPMVRQCERPNELRGPSQPRARAARSCSTATAVGADPSTASPSSTTSPRPSLAFTPGTPE